MFCYFYYDVLEALCRSLFQDILTEAQEEALEEIAKKEAEEEENSDKSGSGSDRGPPIESCKDDHEEGKDGVVAECEHPDMEQEHRDDILRGDFEAILEKLEVRGQKNNIFKFKEMQELRTKHNKDVSKQLGLFGEDKSMVDSGQVVGAMFIIRYFRKKKLRKQK